MLLKEIDPFVRQAIIGSISRSTEYDVFYELRASDCRLFYIISGRGSIIIENEPYDLHAGDAILFQSGTKYIWQTVGNEVLHYISINFDYTHRFSHIRKPFHPVHADMFSDEDVLESIVFSNSTILNRHILLPNAQALEAKFRRLVTEYYLGGAFSDELLSTLLKALIISIVREFNIGSTQSSGGGFELTRDIMQYIQGHYGEELSYDRLAEIYHLNPIYINRVFKKNSGISLHSFIVNYRINMAMELLRSTNTGVKEIAALVGFSDLPHFVRTFKRVTGRTPAKYRNSAE